MIRTRGNLFSFKRLSIQQRLPLLICAFLLFSIVIYGFANYYSLRKATLTIGRDRLKIVTSQISSMLGQSAQFMVTATHTAATKNSVIQCLKSGGKEFRKETLDELDKLHRDSTWVLIELLDHKLMPVLRSAKSTVNVKINTKDVLAFTHVDPDSSKVGKIYNVRGSMYYPIIAAVTEKKHIIGYVICWQLLRTTPKAVQQLSQLMGAGAILYIGNTDGSLWTNMIKPVAGPPIKADHLNDLTEYTKPNGGVMIANAQAVVHTDWLTVVEFSEERMMDGVSGFMNWIIIFGVVLTSVGIFAAWVMSRNITRPLNQLTAAATAISKGNYSMPISINVDRNDELGDLAHAFNIMTVNVQQTQHELEEKVKERTAKLSEEIRLRKISEEILRVSRQRYLLLVEEVKDYAIIMLDANGKVLLWNKGAEKIKGYREEEILGKPSSYFYTEEDIKNNKPQQLLEKATKEGRAEDEGWRVRKDGSRFWADVVYTAIYDEDKKLMGFAKISRDITERKKLEEEQRIISAELEERVKEVAIRTLQLETSNKELEAFSYSVSHDLRTPLRAINGYSIMLKEDYEAKLDAEGNRIIRNIITNAKMMGKLIDDLLSFSRLGKKELIRTSIDMRLLATNVVNELLQNELEKDYRINIGLLSPAEADPGMIKQVLANLVSNAIKYSSKKENPEIEIGSKDEEAQTIYYVKDNGVGFDMAYAGKLFGVFQRLHSQEEFEGTGVGLALVKRIIDKHNGEIWAEGLENIGATFYFSLPKKSNHE
jgi:PAS domain S-box-containing protein